MAPALAFLLLAVALGVHAAILTEYPPTVQLNTDTGDITAQKFVDVTCSYTDWQSSSPALTFSVTSTDTVNPKTYDISVQCLPPTYVYELSVTGYIPRDGRLAIVDFCRAQTGSINATYMDVVNRAVLPSNVGRRLLGIFDVSDWGGNLLHGIMCDSSGLFSGMGLMASNRAAGQTGKAAANGDTVSKGLAYASLATGALNFAASASGACGGTGIDPATQHALDGLTTRIDDQEIALKKATGELWDNVTATFHELHNFMDTQDLINRNVTDQLALNYRTAVLANDQTNTVYQYARSVGDTAKKDINEVRGYVADAFGAIGRIDSTIAAFTGAVDTQIKSAFNDARASINSVAASLSNLSDVVESNRVSDYVSLIQVTSQLRSLAGVAMRGLMRFQDRRVFTRAALRDVDTVLAMGFVPFLEDLGAAPTVDPTDFNLMIDTIWVRTLAGGIAHEEQYGVYCSGTFIADALGPWLSPEAVMSAIGPQNCSTTDSTENPCHCFILHLSRQCTALSSLTDSNSVDYYQISTGAWRQNMRLNATAHCSSGVTESTSDLIRSGDELSASLASISRYDTNLGDATYVISAAFANLQTALPFDAALVNLTTMRMFKDKTERTIGRLFTTLISLTTGNFAALGDAVTRALDGLIPNGVSIYDYPFSTQNGVPAQCTQSMWMAYSPDWIPQYRLLIKDVRLDMVATMTDTDTLVATTIPITDITYTNTMQMQLPGDVLVAGSPFPDADGIVYDVEQRAMSTSPDAGARMTTVSYALCPDPNGCTATQFRNTTGQKFDARSGSNVAALYAHKLQRDANGIFRCAANAANTSGPSSLCDLRDRYDITPGDPLNRTLLAKPMKSGSYVSRFSVPLGTVQQLIVSTCPTATVQQITADGTTLRLVNARPRTVILTLEYNTITCCASRSTETVSVPAGGSVSVWIPSCTGAGGCRTQSVRASIQGGALCPNINGVDVTPLSRSEAVVARGVPDLVHVQRTASVATDQVLSATVSMVVSLTDAISRLLIEQYAANRQNGVIDVPEHNFTDAFKSITDSLAGILNDVNNTRTNITTHNVSADFDSLSRDFDSVFIANQISLQALFNGTAAGLATLSSLNTLQRENIAHYDAAVNATVVAIGRYEEAQATYNNLTGQMFHTIVRALDELSTPNNDFGFDPSDLGRVLAKSLSLVPEGIAWVGKEADAIVTKAIELAGGALAALAGGIGNVLMILFIAVGVIFGIIFLVVGVWYCKKKKMFCFAKEGSYKPVMDQPTLD